MCLAERFQDLFSKVEYFNFIHSPKWRFQRYDSITSLLENSSSRKKLLIDSVWHPWVTGFLSTWWNWSLNLQGRNCGHCWQISRLWWRSAAKPRSLRPASRRRYFQLFSLEFNWYSWSNKENRTPHRTLFPPCDVSLQVHPCCGKWQNFIPFYVLTNIPLRIHTTSSLSAHLLTDI